MNWMEHEIMRAPIGEPREDAPVGKGGKMIVYCDDEECKWNEEGKCQGPKHPAGHTALYIERNWMGQNCCTDFKEKNDEDS